MSVELEDWGGGTPLAQGLDPGGWDRERWESNCPTGGLLSYTLFHDPLLALRTLLTKDP